MPVISSTIPSYRWFHLWPLVLFILLTLGILCGLWFYWPQILYSAIHFQRAINQELSELLRQVAEHPNRAGWSLLAFSFVYGVLHALGLGHGKVVISTWLATHPEKIKAA